MITNIISTWIYLDSPNESSEYPQVGKSSHTPEFQKIYWRCVAVFFALSKKFNPDCRHILFTNQDASAIPVIDGWNLADFLDAQSVEIVTLPLTYQTPQGYFGRWRNQFYIFDIVQYMAANGSAEDVLIVLDSDCLIRASLDTFFENVRSFGLAVLPMPYEETHVINGVTRLDLKQIYSDLQNETWPAVPMYWGGELFAANFTALQQISSLAPSIWEKMLERHQSGLKKFNEEAHMLSYCYEVVDSKYIYADTYIKRIWTAPQHNNVTVEDAELPIWHLPSEKTGGIALLYEELSQNKGIWKASSEVIAATIGTYVGVPKRTKWFNLRQRFRYTLVYKWLKKI